MRGTLLLALFCSISFAMKDELFTLGAQEFWKKSVAGKISIPEKVNKGEFYRAQKNGKIIFSLGTSHNIGCSKFADEVLDKVKEHLEKEGISKIDVLWTEISDFWYDYHVKDTTLDSLYKKGLKSISKVKRTDVLDKFTWSMLTPCKKDITVRNTDAHYSVEITDEDRKEFKELDVTQCFMRGCPAQMLPMYWQKTWLQSIIINDYNHDDYFKIRSRNREWVSKLLNEEKIQFIVAGGCHNWHSTGVLKLLEEKGWEIEQIDLDMDANLIINEDVYSVFPNSWLESISMNWFKIFSSLLEDLSLPRAEVLWTNLIYFIFIVFPSACISTIVFFIFILSSSIVRSFHYLYSIFYNS